MPVTSPSELKKSLIAAGFEVYRTVGDRVLLADRVRDNLIMDSGVAAVAGDVLRVRFVVRAQATGFPGESPDGLFDRARSMAATARDRGFVEADAVAVPVKDPGDKAQTLDTWYEVAYEKQVEGTDELIAELRYALGLDKTASNVPA